MPDLTDADLEAMEKRCEAATSEWSDVRFSLSTVAPGPLKWTHSHAKWYMDNLPALIAALREARGERDTMAELYAREGHKSLVLLNENTSLLAENRLLRDTYCDDTCCCRQRSETELASKAPLTAAEVERVQILELAAKLLDGCHEWLMTLLQSEAHAIVRDTCPEWLHLVDVATVLVALAREEKNIE